ncbi:MAG TPA: imidazoleglycerol-phosphate dehydratase HisB [Thermomicrobiaceae bacterium]|nr:imidazoleglycerol-phosphate dehydratase HisB [Thermomicrobiaceae bacterium]
MGPRIGSVARHTAETDVAIQLSLDGTGDSTVDTGIPPLDHFLTLFARHGQFDLTVTARGDLGVDAHHTTEDVGLCLGQALRQALGERRGIRRTADAAVPMDEALAHVAVDCGGRGYYVQRDPFVGSGVGTLEVDLVRHFLDTLAHEARINLHLVTLYGVNTHHQVEAVFKAFARALDAATAVDPRLGDRLPSTKEHIETA